MKIFNDFIYTDITLNRMYQKLLNVETLLTSIPLVEFFSITPKPL